MNPLRWDVLLVGFVLAVPVLALGARGDLSVEEVVNRMLWCLGAGWVVVALVRLAMTPRTASQAGPDRDAGVAEDSTAAGQDRSPA